MKPSGKQWDFSSGEVKPGGPVRETAMSDAEVLSAVSKRSPKTAVTGVRNMESVKTDKERSVDAKWRDPAELAGRETILKMTPGGASGGGALIQRKMGDDEGYPRGYNPARQREVVSAMSVTSDDIRRVGHRAAAAIPATLTSEIKKKEGRINDFPNSMTAEQDSEQLEKLKSVDVDTERVKAHQAVEDAAAAHVPGKEHVLVSDARERIGPMEMEELGKALPKTSKKRDTPARAKKFSEMTGKARTVEAIARSTVPAEHLQTMKESQLDRATSGSLQSSLGMDNWSEQVPATLGRVMNAPKTHAMIKLNETPDSKSTLGWVEGSRLGEGPVNISRHPEPKTKLVDNYRTVRDANGDIVRNELGATQQEKTGTQRRVATARTSYTSLDNAETQMFYPIPKGTPKDISQRRREKQSRVTQTLIHELGHAAEEANKGGWTGTFKKPNTDIPEYGETGGQNPYRAPDAMGSESVSTDWVARSGVIEATAENYADKHWRPDPRFKVEGRSSNYDSRYNNRYGSKNGANTKWRKTYAANRIDMTPAPSKLEKLTEEQKQALGGDEG